MLLLLLLLQALLQLGKGYHVLGSAHEAEGNPGLAVEALRRGVVGLREGQAAAQEELEGLTQKLPREVMGGRGGRGGGKGVEETGRGLEEGGGGKERRGWKKGVGNGAGERRGKGRGTRLSLLQDYCILLLLECC